MKRTINGIPMWLTQRLQSGHLYWYGTSINPRTGRQRCHYIGKTLPPETDGSEMLLDPDDPFPNDGLIRCCRCGQHPCTDVFFTLCPECREEQYRRGLGLL